jgi:hypothetical protein
MVWINFITLSSYIGMENGMRALDNAIFYGRMERRESNQQRCANHSDLFDRMKVMPFSAAAMAVAGYDGCGMRVHHSSNG